MRIDLHTHSSASDGTDTPGDLVRAAAAAGLDVVALTDHDAMSGWAEAQLAADEVGITLVPGLEISTRYGHRGVHLLGLPARPGPRPLAPPSTASSSGAPPARPRSSPRCAPTASTSPRTTYAASRAGPSPRVVPTSPTRSRGSAWSGPHQAFATLLTPGGRATQPLRAALEDMVALVVAAGGVAVIAHPWGRGSRSVLSAEDLAELKDLGLAGIEVDHQDHSAADRAELRGIATDLDLVVTGSSDHHGLGKVDHDLGVNTTDPEQYERLVSLAGRPALGG